MGSNLNKKAYAIKLANRIKSTIKYAEEGEKSRTNIDQAAYKSPAPVRKHKDFPSKY